MKKFKRLIAIATVLLFALSIIAPAFAQDEAAATTPYDDAAKVLVDKGIMKGDENGDLMLDKQLTRAEILALIIRATGQEDAVADYVYNEPSFSDVPQDHWAFAYVEAGKDLGIVNGYPDGTFKPDKPVKFEELCKMLVAAKNENPASGKWPLNYVRKALELGFFTQIEDEVGIGDLVIRGQAAVAFANAFFPPEKTIVVKDAYAKDNTTVAVTLSVYGEGSLEDGDVIPLDFEIKQVDNEAYTIAVKSVSIDVNTGVATLTTDSQKAGVQYKVYFKGQDTGFKFAGIAIPLTVTKVEALNYGELKVTFNKEVDNTTYATTKGNYTIKVGTATVLVSNITLASDKKSAVLLLASNFTSSDTVSVTVSKNVGMAADYSTTISNFVDTTAPTVDSVTGVGLTKIIVKFSEAVKGADNPANYLVDGAYTPPTVQVDDAKRTATLTFYSPLSAGSHTLQFLSGIKDYADYGLVTPLKSFSLTGDTTAVTAPTVVSATQTSLKLKFNKGIMQVTSVSVSPSGAEYTGYSVDTSDPTLVTLSFSTTNPLPASGAVVTVAVMDVSGNSATGLSATVIPTVDVVRPAYVSYTIDGQAKIRVTFSEDVQTSGTFKLTESDGDVLVPSLIAYYVDSYGTTYKTQLVLTFPRNIDTGTCTLDISDVKDMSPLANAIVATTVSVTMTDKTAPSVASAVYEGSPMSKLYITFSEAVERTSALTPANYTLTYTSGSTKAVSSISSAYLTLLSDGKTVLINFGSSTQSGVSGVMVANVADPSGNKIASYVTSLTQVPGTNPLVSAVAMTAKNKVKLTVVNGGKLAYVSPSDFIVYYNANDDLTSTSDDTIAAYATAVSYDSSANTITLTLSKDLESDAKFKVSDTNLKDLYVKLNPNGVVTKDIFDKAITMAAPIKADDNCAPSVTVATGDNTREIKITFSETVALTNSDYSTLIKIVDGLQSGDTPTMTVTTVNNRTVAVISGLTAYKTYKVRIDPNVADTSAAANKIGYVADISVTTK